MEAYLDNSATTICHEGVKNIMVEAMTKDYGNPSSMHQKGVEAEKYVKEHPDAYFVPEKSVWTANIKYDIALPCATQGEIDGDMAKNMVENCEISAIFLFYHNQRKDVSA